MRDKFGYVLEYNDKVLSPRINGVGKVLGATACAVKVVAPNGAVIIDITDSDDVVLYQKWTHDGITDILYELKNDMADLIDKTVEKIYELANDATAQNETKQSVS